MAWQGGSEKGEDECEGRDRMGGVDGMIKANDQSFALIVFMRYG